MRLSTEKETRRERPKSAPYLRLKNIQGTTIGKIWKKKFSKKLFLKFKGGGGTLVSPVLLET